MKFLRTGLDFLLAKACCIQTLKADLFVEYKLLTFLFLFSLQSFAFYYWQQPARTNLLIPTHFLKNPAHFPIAVATHCLRTRKYSRISVFLSCSKIIGKKAEEEGEEKKY